VHWMQRDNRPYKIIFLNQMAGPLFRELAMDLAREWPPCLLYTGHRDTLEAPAETSHLHIQKGASYDRKSLARRAITWLTYFVRAVVHTGFGHRRTMIFLVSNPPFLGLLGALFKWVRKQPYVILVYDIYPDLLINLGRIPEGVISKGWRALNFFVYHHADQVLTIGQDMALRLERGLGGDPRRMVGNIAWVWPWADVEKIRPIAKENNPFALAHEMVGRTTVLYSGNMGHTHDMETIVRAAERLSSCKDILFVLIGEGVKYTWLEGLKAKGNMVNVLLLPLQPEAVLPQLMASADIGITTYEKGSEGCILPSKTAYYMAAGAATIIISHSETDLTQMVNKAGCGVWIKGGDDASLADTVLALHQDPERLKCMKMKARRTAEADFSRKNTEKFKNVLMQILK